MLATSESHRHHHHNHKQNQQQQLLDVMMIKCNQSPSSSSSPTTAISLSSSSSSINNPAFTTTTNLEISNHHHQLHGMNTITTTTPAGRLPPPPQNVNLTINNQNSPYFRNFDTGKAPEPTSSMVGQAALGVKFCAGCGGKILDRYLLWVADRYWHETCLRCSHCGKILNDQKSLFVKNDRIYCRDDYLRLFRPDLLCSVCQNVIQPAEQMMKVYANLYHLDCFACQECTHRFCIGEKYYFDRRINKILCENDFEERKVFSSFSAGDLNRIKRKISKDIV